MEYIGHLQYDDILHKENQIVLCGAGNDLQKIIEQLKNVGLLDKVVRICDNDKTKWTMKTNGIMICSYEEAYDKYKNAAYIVYNRYKIEIYRQIKKKAKKIHMLWM